MARSGRRSRPTGKVNAEGGINGRKVNFITYDDGYSTPKTVEMVRKLVEEDQVLATFQLLGTPTNTAIHKYMNQKKVPHLFVATGASKWGDPKNFPWTMGWQPDYATEGGIYAKHILAEVKDPKIAILWQNDDAGKDYVGGFIEGPGQGEREAGRRLGQLRAHRSDRRLADHPAQEFRRQVFFDMAAPKQAAQAIRKVAELGWKPVNYLANVSASVASVLKPAGFENSQGIITAAYLKDPTDKQWADDADFQEWKAWMTKYNPGGNLADSFNVYAYAVSATMHEVLKRCGDELTRANIMKQAASLKDLEVPLLLPGIKINTSPTDFYPIQAVRLQRFKGETWELFGDVLKNESS